jgi:iron complex transport system ATP-binding protein
MTPVVEAQAVTVRAGAATLLASVDVAVGGGECIAIVGPNGAGKSTLLRCLSGDASPHSGTVTLKGRPLAGFTPAALARHRAVLSQSVAVAFPFTVDEIVRMGAGSGHGRAIDGIVEAALAEVDLAHARQRVITAMSGGEQHRAHLARVLVQLACGERDHGPGLLLLDEPTASLDLRHQIDFVAMAHRRAATGTAVVAVLHDLNLAATFADRIVVLDRGSVAGNGAVAATLTDDMLAKVFAIHLAREGPRAAGMPFVLPQMMVPPPPVNPHHANRHA